MQERVYVTMKDIRRYQLLTDVVNRNVTISEACSLLGVSYRHCLRLRDTFIKQGFEGLVKKPRNLLPHQKVTTEICKEILNLRDNLYWDFNIQHFREKLEKEHNIKLSYETIRQILIKAEKVTPQHQKQIYRRRRRMPKAGMLVQMDTSEHRWIESIPQRWSLVTMIDDATNEVPFAYFAPKDTTFANMFVIRKFLELKGVFMGLYVDKASHFKTIRHGGLHVEVSPEQDETQIGRALRELGIIIIPANSPQAKGRIERLFRLFQDRLIKEMRLSRIENYSYANEFLQQQFLPWYNQRFTYFAESAYMPLPRNLDLDIVFSLQHVRTVLNDHTVQFLGYTIQLPPSNKKLSLAGQRVIICQHQDNRITILYNNNIILKTTLLGDNKTILLHNQQEELLSQREYEEKKLNSTKKERKIYIPSSDHPWRQYDKTKYTKK